MKKQLKELIERLKNQYNCYSCDNAYYETRGFKISKREKETAETLGETIEELCKITGEPIEKITEKGKAINKNWDIADFDYEVYI